MTIALPSDDEMQNLRNLGAAYYAAQHAISRTYFMPVFNAAVGPDGTFLDPEGYAADLDTMLAFVHDAEVAYAAPTEQYPDEIHSMPMFGYFDFECRRQLRRLRPQKEVEN